MHGQNQPQQNIALLIFYNLNFKINGFILAVLGSILILQYYKMKIHVNFK